MFLTSKDSRPRWLFSMPSRTLGAVLVMLVGFGFAVSIYMQAFSEDIYSIRKQGLESIVSLAQNSLVPVLEDRRGEKLSVGEARIKATEVINQFVYYNKGVSNYVFLGTYEGYVLVEPPFPETVGTYQMQRKDAYGTPVTKLLLDKARSGGGFVEYYEAQSPDEKLQKKISYVIGLPEIECYLGTGIYVDDIDESISQLQKKLMLLGFLIMAGVLALQYYFVRPLLRCLYWLAEVFKNLSENPDAVHSFKLPLQFKNTDTEQLFTSLKSMLINFNMYRQNVEQSAEKFRQIAYATNDIIWEWDNESRTTVWSGNIEKIVGCEPNGYGAHFEMFEEWVHPDDRKMRRQALAAHFSGSGESYTCEYRLQKAEQNEYLWVLAKGIASFDDNGTPRTMVGSIITISGSLQNAAMKLVEQKEGLELTGFRKIGDISHQTPYVNGDLLVVDVKKRLHNEQWQGMVVVEDRKPIGLVMRDVLNFQLSGQYGASLYYGRPVRVIMDENPLIVASDVSLEQVAEAAGNRPEAKLYDLIIVTENGEYHGTVSVMELLSHISDLRIQLAANANPLTGLPGNILIDQKLKSLVEKGSPFAVLYVDLDNFKAFNDKYGFEHGDKALLLTADILKSSVARTCQQEFFLGHIGGDDFIVISSPAEIDALCTAIIQQFDREIVQLYNPIDLEKGAIVIQNRRGRLERFPIMTVSIGVAHTLHHHFTNYLEIAEIAAVLKKKAKAMKGSTYMIDQRETD
ncbi:MAG: cache domain-containing protein [Negativicutes bacterium]|nr:cache domain-containing protein [Negativicutes bacterium]